MKKIVLASNNLGKIEEFRSILTPLSIEILTMKEANIEGEADETGLTFIENALLKARYASEKSGLPALADDSGLVVPALNGAPGIYSARYSKKGNDLANNHHLLHEMKNLTENERIAYFKSVLILIQNPEDPTPLIAEGEVYGSILTEMKGNSGFGYDPLFYLKDLKQTFAEISLEHKNQLSHRAKASKILVEKINIFNNM